MNVQFKIRKMHERGGYRIYRYLGMTDGRPSWGRENLINYRTRGEAAAEVSRLQLSSPEDELLRSITNGASSPSRGQAE